MWKSRKQFVRIRIALRFLMPHLLHHWVYVPASLVPWHMERHFLPSPSSLEHSRRERHPVVVRLTPASPLSSAAATARTTFPRLSQPKPHLGPPRPAQPRKSKQNTLRAFSFKIFPPLSLLHSSQKSETFFSSFSFPSKKRERERERERKSTFVIVSVGAAGRVVVYVMEDVSATKVDVLEYASARVKDVSLL